MYSNADRRKQPLILMCAPNGARLQKSDHSAISLTSDDMAREAVELVEAGGSVLHMHVRNPDGSHSLDADIYKHFTSAVRGTVGDKLIIQITTEAVGIYSRAQQMSLVRELKPEAVSLALNELCPTDEHLTEAAKFFKEVKDQGTWPQYILYSADDVKRFNAYRKKGVFGDDNPFVLFVLGRYSTELIGQAADLDDFLLAMDGADFPWGLCCFGKNESLATNQAWLKGGHARLGFENNRILPDGSPAASNQELIEQTLNSINVEKSDLATPSWVRNKFNLRY